MLFFQMQGFYIYFTNHIFVLLTAQCIFLLILHIIDPYILNVQALFSFFFGFPV